MTESEIQEILDSIPTIVEQILKQIARSKKIQARKACLVATYDSVSDTATLYMPPDLDTESSVSYKNLTGSTLSTNQKVDILHDFTDEDQGVIVTQY